MKLISSDFSLKNNKLSLVVRKKPIAVKVKFADKAGNLTTLEGDVGYEAGAAILTGDTGVKWPVERAKFDASYDAVNGADGNYQKRPIEVLAMQLTEPTSVKVGYVNDLITGQVGDWLVQYGEGDFGIVGEEIFAKTYEILSR